MPDGLYCVESTLCSRTFPSHIKAFALPPWGSGAWVGSSGFSISACLYALPPLSSNHSLDCNPCLHCILVKLNAARMTQNHHLSHKDNWQLFFTFSLPPSNIIGEPG